MLSESDREEFKKPAASYMNALSTLEHKEDEIYRFAKTCGAYADWRVLAKIILPLPDLCRARSHLIRKYYELRDEPPLGLGNAIKLTRSYPKESCKAGRGINARGHTQEKCGCRQPRVWDSYGLGGRAGDYAPRSGSRQRPRPGGLGSRSKPHRRN